MVKKKSILFLLMCFVIISCSPKPTNEPIVIEKVDERAFLSSQEIVSEASFHSLNCKFKLLKELDRKTFFSMKSIDVLVLECDDSNKVSLLDLKSAARKYMNALSGKAIKVNGPIHEIVMYQKFKYLDALHAAFYSMDNIVSHCDLEYSIFHDWNSQCFYLGDFLNKDISDYNNFELAHKTLALRYAKEQFELNSGLKYSPTSEDRYMRSWPQYQKRIEAVNELIDPLTIVLSNLDKYIKGGIDEINEVNHF